MVDDDVGLVSNFQKYNDVGSPPKKLWNYKNNVFTIWIIKKQQLYLQKNYKYRL